MREKLFNQIKKARFLTLVLDEGTDVNNRSQLSVSLKYSLSGKSKESFLEFVDLKEKKSAEEIVYSTKKFLYIFNFESKLICQSYDGAYVISGRHSGVLTGIKQNFKRAGFIYCRAHAINLSFKKSVHENIQVRVLG